MSKWIWMMDWCKHHGLAPARKSVWEAAERAWDDRESSAEGAGFWRSCSGCHETNEGYTTGPYSQALKCHLGVGCRECGGTGSVWDDTDYDAMADFMEQSMDSPQLAEQVNTDSAGYTLGPISEGEMNKLFSDLKTDEEKSNFFLSGRGYETGVIAPAIQNDVAMAYHHCVEYKKELEALRLQGQEDAERLKLRLETIRALYPNAPSDAELDAAIDHALRIEGDGK